MTEYQTIVRALLDPGAMPAFGARLTAALDGLGLELVKFRAAVPLSGGETEPVEDAAAESLMDRWLSMNSQPPTVEVLHAIAVTTRGPEGLEDEVTEAVGSSFGESTPWAGETTVVEGFGEGGRAE
ncbi:hypothetical protein CJ204_02110 [Corynebacterium xerosis]|uniref:Uncharacterized protein n=1 Tax=Corynebacterium xerosis TaxID=1725 RepID=A0A2N6T172_9CORY|nr:hypothetical protein [Corynebacterium xerosis]PMC63052.1 hypothetical protein CJ204_02110 [Corynebacterium xerosis]